MIINTIENQLKNSKVLMIVKESFTPKRTFSHCFGIQICHTCLLYIKNQIMNIFQGFAYL